ncbi:MAG: hypothetical protein ACI8UO_005483 [Verrucomicrobiales bacterium]|jgi:hypothetical protein
MGFGALALGGILPSAAADSALNPLAPKRPQFAAKAKRVIHLFMNGGPSQVDTFDPKPMLTKFHGKTLPGEHLKTERKTGTALKSPWKFRQYGESGLPVSDLFPNVGKMADELCVLRSMHANVPNHEPSLMLMNTGDERLARPSMGAWITYGLGTENENLPGFVALCPNGVPIVETQNWRSAFLPGAFQGTHVDTKHTAADKLIQNIKNAKIPLRTQRAQLDLIQELNAKHLAERQEDAKLESRIHSLELAYRMQLEASDAFDVGREPESIQELYGRGQQGRQMLIARRLVERGVRFVQVWHGAGQPWDSHSQIEKAHGKLAGECDQAIGALLLDLKQRGLLDDTLVIWGGEFGRTPTVELPTPGANAADTALGRDHNHHGFSMWLAGGGVKGGMAYGATDEFGFKAQENPVHIHDLHATILHLLGFDHERLTFRYAGRDFRLTDVHGRVVGEIIG